MANADVGTYSRSLYNITQAPGWDIEENRVLRLAMIRFGLGSWTKILRLGILPGKTVAQLNLQVQRMVGQQSIGGFFGIKLDPDAVRKDNESQLREGQLPGTYRIKTGLLVNDAENPTPESVKKLREENQEKYGLTDEQIKELVDDADLFLIKRRRRAELATQIEEANTIREKARLLAKKKKEERGEKYVPRESFCSGIKRKHPDVDLDAISASERKARLDAIEKEVTALRKEMVGLLHGSNASGRTSR